MLVDKYECRSPIGCNFTAKIQRSFGEGGTGLLPIGQLQISHGLQLYRTPDLQVIIKLYAVLVLHAVQWWQPNGSCLQHFILFQTTNKFPVSHNTRNCIIIFTAIRTWSSWTFFTQLHAVCSRSFLKLSCLSLSSGAVLRTTIFNPLALELDI